METLSPWFDGVPCGFSSTLVLCMIFANYLNERGGGFYFIKALAKKGGEDNFAAFPARVHQFLRFYKLIIQLIIHKCCGRRHFYYHMRWD